MSIKYFKLIIPYLYSVDNKDIYYYKYVHQRCCGYGKQWREWEGFIWQYGYIDGTGDLIPEEWVAVSWKTPEDLKNVWLSLCDKDRLTEEHGLFEISEEEALKEIRYHDLVRKMKK